MDTLGKRISSHRKRLGLTQDQLAEKLGVTAQAVSKWENDQSCPDITMLPRLSELFGISTDELLGREPETPVHRGEVESGTGWNGFQDSHHLQSNLKKTSLWSAILVIAVGALYLADGLFHLKLGFWTVLWTTALTVYGISGLWPRFRLFRMGCAVVGVYCLFSRIVTLPVTLSSQVFVAAAILLIGLGLLTDAIRSRKKPSGMGKMKAPSFIYDADASGFSYSCSFGENTQRVDMETLKRGSVDASFGEATLDLSGVTHVSEGAELHTDCSFGELTILVPRRFRVKSVTDTSFAQFSTEGEPDPGASETLTVMAETSFGETVVRYI